MEASSKVTFSSKYSTGQRQSELCSQKPEAGLGLLPKKQPYHVRVGPAPKHGLGEVTSQLILRENVKSLKLETLLVKNPAISSKTIRYVALSPPSRQRVVTAGV